jgi:hypothetical protein
LARQWQTARSENIEISREAPDAAALADAAPALAAPGATPRTRYAAPPRARRWSGSAWLFWRENGGGIAADKLKANSADRRPGVRI